MARPLIKENLVELQSPIVSANPSGAWRLISNDGRSGSLTSPKTWQILDKWLQNNKDRTMSSDKRAKEERAFFGLVLEVQKVEENLKKFREGFKGGNPRQWEALASEFMVQYADATISDPVRNAIMSRVATSLNIAESYAMSSTPKLQALQADYFSKQTQKRPEIVRELERKFVAKDYPAARKMLKRFDGYRSGRAGSIVYPALGVLQEHLPLAVEAYQEEVRKEGLNKRQRRRATWELNYWSGRKGGQLVGEEAQVYDETSELPQILQGNGTFDEELPAKRIEIDSQVRRLSHPDEAVREDARKKLHNMDRQTVLTAMAWRSRYLQTHRHASEITKFYDEAVGEKKTITPEEASRVMFPILRSFARYRDIANVAIPIAGKARTPETAEVLSSIAANQSLSIETRSWALSSWASTDWKGLRSLSKEVRNRLVSMAFENTRLATLSREVLGEAASKGGRITGALLAAASFAYITYFVSPAWGIAAWVLPFLGIYLGMQWDFYKNTGLSPKFRSDEPIQHKNLYNTEDLWLGALFFAVFVIFTAWNMEFRF